MKQKKNVLIIEDHPIVAMAYKSALEFIESSTKDLIFNVSTADDCDSANDAIMKAVKGTTIIDIVFLDINLKSSKDLSILSGEDIGVKINKFLPKTKIMVCTTHCDTHRIQSIIKNVDPAGFLVKNDFDSDELIYAINKIVSSLPYFSTTVLTSISQKIKTKNILDGIDRRLIFELSLGTKMKDLPNFLPLSMAGIERRKRNLMEAFSIDKKTDKELILIAKDKGFI